MFPSGSFTFQNCPSVVWLVVLKPKKVHSLPFWSV
jgi:hypothetical protein